MLSKYASLYDGLCILLCIMIKILISAFILVHGFGTVFMSVHDHGVVCPYSLVLVACSSSVGGSGMLHLLD